VWKGTLLAPQEVAATRISCEWIGYRRTQVEVDKGWAGSRTGLENRIGQLAKSIFFELLKAVWLAYFETTDLL
jgi:hypothetical protein